MALPVYDQRAFPLNNTNESPFCISTTGRIIETRVGDLSRPRMVISPTKRSKALKIVDYLGVIPFLGSAIGIFRLISGIVVGLISLAGQQICSTSRNWHKSRKWAILSAKAFAEATQGGIEILPFATLIDLMRNRPNNFLAWEGLMASKHHCYVAEFNDDLSIHGSNKVVVGYHPREVACHQYKMLPYTMDSYMEHFTAILIPEHKPWDLLSEAEKEKSIDESTPTPPYKENLRRPIPIYPTFNIQPRKAEVDFL